VESLADIFIVHPKGVHVNIVLKIFFRMGRRWFKMPPKIKKECSHPGCHELTIERYCPECQEKYGKQEQKAYDKRRGSSASRGYGSRWSKASKAFLSKPENQFCVLRLPGCTGIADTTDHIDPVDGPNDPKFWNRDNWQPS